MASIEWKGAKWEAYRSSLSIPELLTVLKGYGPMEIVTFEVAGRFNGEMSLCLTDDGRKEITLYHLEVTSEKHQGAGREALKWLKDVFKGPVFVEFPDSPDPETGTYSSIQFWLQMFREGLIDAVDCETFYLSPDASSDRVEEVRSRFAISQDENSEIS